MDGSRHKGKAILTHAYQGFEPFNMLRSIFPPIMFLVPWLGLCVSAAVRLVCDMKEFEAIARISCAVMISIGLYFDQVYVACLRDVCGYYVTGYFVASRRLFG